MITRHFVQVAGRRMHYRVAGRGPALLMAHQSPRSSAEHEPLMRRWAAYFTCIAVDTPGFGQSDRLPLAEPGIDDFGDALIAFMDALGLGPVGAYGFHSGGIILMNALKRHPQRFTALGCGGYAIWTPGEMASFSYHYLPPFEPSAYGEHLTWLWHRILEQSWFFPWFTARDECRLRGAHDDPLRVDAVIRDMLDAGSAYRAGYGAVLGAPRDIPTSDAAMPPVLIAAYDGDPLQTHIDRIGTLPALWSARKVATADALEAVMLAHLRAHPAAAPDELAEANDQGFVHVATSAYDGLIHWRGATIDNELHIHAPGASTETLAAAGSAMDLPGHGLSDAWPGTPPVDRAAWNPIISAVAAARSCDRIAYAPTPRGDPARLFPNLTPDRFGAYLARAWSVARARVLFEPWYCADAAHARRFDPAELAPERLAVTARELLRAVAARAAMIALS